MKSIKSSFDDTFYYVSQVPEDWEITWETGTLKTLLVEYKKTKIEIQIIY